MIAQYIHGYDEGEFQRLIGQARVLAPAVFSGIDLTHIKTLLELGCGVGAQTREILDRWPHLQIIGVDKSEKHLSRASGYLNSEISSGKVSLSLGEAESLPLSNDSMDAAVTIWVLEHVNSPERILKEINRVLKPGGQIILNEVDNNTFRFFPENNIIQSWWNKFNEFQQLTADPFIGAKLASCAQAAGFLNIKTEPLYIVSSQREPNRRSELLLYLEALLLSGSESLKASNLVSQQDEDQLKNEFKRIRTTNDDFQYLAVRLTATKSAS